MHVAGASCITIQILQLYLLRKVQRPSGLSSTKEMRACKALGPLGTLHRAGSFRRPIELVALGLRQLIGGSGDLSS